MAQLKVVILLLISAGVAALVSIGIIFLSINRGWIPATSSSLEVIEIPRIIEPTPILNPPIPLIIIEGEFRVLYDPINPEATMPVRIVTVTPFGNEVADTPSDQEEPEVVSLTTPTPFAVEGYVTSLPTGCTLHTVSAGENLSFIAARWGVDLNLLLDINDLSLADATSLQPGERLIIPWASCVAALYQDQNDGGSELIPVATEAPTQLIIETVRGVGDWESEEVVIRNRGETSVDLAGWMIRNEAGDEYSFGNQRLFAGAEMRLATRSGADLPTQLFWGLPAAVWASGGEVSLYSPDGDLQFTYTLP